MTTDLKAALAAYSPYYNSHRSTVGEDELFEALRTAIVLLERSLPLLEAGNRLWLNHAACPITNEEEESPFFKLINKLEAHGIKGGERG